MKNREIKFRAWDSKLKMWCYDGEPFTIFGEVLMVDGFSSHFIENPLRDSDGKYISSLERWNDIELMQFTGLLDKNGKEIYEGDIIAWDYEYDADYDGDMPIVKRLIGKKVVEDIFDRWQIVVAKSEGDGVEIIGNLHQNPELL